MYPVLEKTPSYLFFIGFVVRVRLFSCPCINTHSHNVLVYSLDGILPIRLVTWSQRRTLYFFKYLICLDQESSERVWWMFKLCSLLHWLVPHPYPRMILIGYPTFSILKSIKLLNPCLIVRVNDSHSTTNLLVWPNPFWRLLIKAYKIFKKIQSPSLWPRDQPNG